MPITAHVYQIFIAATPTQVWTALTDSEWTRRWFHGTGFVEPPRAGRAYRTQLDDGEDAVDGVIEELTPPAEGRPGRLVQTWHVLYDAALAAEPISRVEWTVEDAGDGLTRVRLVHGDLALSPLTWRNVKDGWEWVLDSLKTVLETGRPLPPWRPRSEQPAGGAGGPSRGGDGDWHRAQAVEASNSVWELVGVDSRTVEEDEELLRRAYAGAYHWQRAASATPAHEARAHYLIAKALLLTGQPEASLRAADRCLRVTTEHGLVDFDLAYAHEARARALQALGRTEEAGEAWARAVAVPVANAEDRAILAADFADLAAAVSV